MATDPSEDSTRDVSRVICYGNTSRLLEKPEGDNTHEWTVFVRPENEDEDISLYVKRVVFILHVSFENPVREVFNPPFEVTEKGWGQFDVRIEIYFLDRHADVIVINHMLQVISPDNVYPLVSIKKGFFNFVNVSNSLYAKLQASVQKKEDIEELLALRRKLGEVETELSGYKAMLREIGTPGFISLVNYLDFMLDY